MRLGLGVKYVAPVQNTVKYNLSASVPRGYNGQIPKLPNYLNYNVQMSYQNNCSKISQNYLTG